MSFSEKKKIDFPVQIKFNFLIKVLKTAKSSFNFILGSNRLIFYKIFSSRKSLNFNVDLEMILWLWPLCNQQNY